jgi:plasmid maintenance system antidote protein VapI
MRLVTNKVMLEHLIRKSGTAVTDLAEQVKTSRSTIYRLISGKTPLCHDLLAERIEETLGVPPGALFVPVRVSRPVVVRAGQDAA